MHITKSYIWLRDVRFQARHGVDPQEREVGGEFKLSLRVGYDFSRALETDDVADTLSYADLYEKIKEEMSRPSALLEHVAGRIATRLFHDSPGITSADLWLTKCNPPMGADSEGAGVELHLINDKTY